MTYQEKLKDPRWQKKRLEILQRDEFTCQHCQDTANTLHVHHRHYRKGNDPWDYPNEALVTLCACCHTDEESQRNENWGLLERTLRDGGFSEADILDISGAFACNRLSFPQEVIATMIRTIFGSNKLSEKFAAIYFDHLKGRHENTTA